MVGSYHPWATWYAAHGPIDVLHTTNGDTPLSLWVYALGGVKTYAPTNLEDCASTTLRHLTSVVLEGHAFVLPMTFTSHVLGVGTFVALEFLAFVVPSVCDIITPSISVQETCALTDMALPWGGMS